MSNFKAPAQTTNLVLITLGLYVDDGARRAFFLNGGRDAVRSRQKVNCPATAFVGCEIRRHVVAATLVITLTLLALALARLDPAGHDPVRVS